MTIGAVLMVKDEVELLRKNLAYHSAIGVDYFVICDRGSTEESQSSLEDLARSENVHLFRQYLYELEEIDAETMRGVRLAGLAEMRRTFAPDWLFPADTDEFWVPRSGDLASLVGATRAEHLSVRRFNAALSPAAVPSLFDGMGRPQGLLHQEILIGGEFFSREFLEQNSQVSWIQRALHPKFLTTATELLEVVPGFHDIKTARDLKRECPPDLLILHLPFTTLGRFSRKVASARVHLEHVGPTFGSSQQAWHWRRWASLDSAAAIEAEFDKQFLSSEDLERMRESGAVKTIEAYFEAQTEGGASRQEASVG